MLVRGILAAAVSTVLHHSVSDKKGKATMATIIPSTSSRKNYGSAGQSDWRTSSYSESRPGERLDSVPENVNDSLSDGAGGPAAWNEGEESGDERVNEDEEDWDNSRYDYRRAWRLYSIVPVGSALFLVFAALVPEIIAPKPLPSSPSAMRLMLSIILSASFWCLGHSIRIPLYSIFNCLFSGFTVLVYFLSYSKGWRSNRHSTATAYIASFASVIHVLVMAFLQEALRVASFAILSLQWHQSNAPPSPVLQARARDAVFREVWTLAFGWALAEVCAGVIQDYEQLALYADLDTNRRTSESSSKSGNDAVIGDGVNNAVFDEEAADLVRWSMPCVGFADDEDVEGAKALTQVEIDMALVRLANVRARDELEGLYGQPYVDIPVFVSLLQRLDSILLSLGNTLLLAAAYLPKPPHVSSFPSSPPVSPFPQDQPIPHTHMIPLIPTFFILSLIHAFLGILHATPLLARVGIPAAAYASCIVGLALTFAGVGVWIGLW